MKHLPIASYRINRTDNESVIRMLCEDYPKCFFQEGKQRRPLKQNIAADIAVDGDFAVASEMVAAAVEWYESHIGYDHSLAIAGSKRIDLDGRAVGTVTQQEALFARQRIHEFNEKRNEQRAFQSPVKVLGEMHAKGQISHCAVKKLDAPMSFTGKNTSPAPEFCPLHETLAAANNAVVGISDPTMRAAVVKASLDVVIKKFQQVRSELADG